MKNFFLLAAFAVTSIFSAQDKIMIIENNLADLGIFDKYHLHTYAKQFFEADGFTVYFENEIPMDLVNNRCTATTFNLKDQSGMLSTKLVMLIKDCTGKVIFTSDEGLSKQKSYISAYRQAFFNATKSYIAKKATIDFNSAYNLSKANDAKSAIVNNVKTITNTEIETANKLNKTSVKKTDLIFEFLEGKSVGVLKDVSGNILYNITKTSIDNLFTASNKYVDGIVFKKNNKWYFEFTKNDEKITEEIK